MSTTYIDYPRWPHLAREAFSQELAFEKRIYTVEGRQLDYTREFRGYVIAGMGGSGIVGDIIADYLADELDKQILVVKDLELPKFVNKDYLVIAVSYSGNTTETISCYLQCIQRGVPVVAVSTGGKLRELAEKYGLPYVSVPKATAPRYGLPGLLYACLRILAEFEPRLREKIRNDVDESIRAIELALEEYEHTLKQVAEKICNKNVMIYVPRPVASIGVRFKNDMNENAKHIVTVCVLPESEHNDIAVHVRKIENIAVMLVRSQIIEKTRLDYAKHVQAVKRVLEEYSYTPIEVVLKGQNLLAEIMYGVTQLGMLSLDVARLINVDPVAIEAIDKVKKYVS